MLLRLAYLGITNAFTLLRLLPGGDRDKDIEILSVRHQLTVLQRQLDGQRVRFERVDRAWLAALLHPLPRPTLRRVHRAGCTWSTAPGRRRTAAARRCGSSLRETAVRGRSGWHAGTAGSAPRGRGRRTGWCGSGRLCRAR